MRLTLACPVALLSDGNALMSALGSGPADGDSFAAPVWHDAAGQAYAVASAVVDDTYLARLRQTLKAPRWACDLKAAKRAQALVQVDRAATSDALTLVICDVPADALARLGLQPIPEEDASAA